MSLYKIYLAPFQGITTDIFMNVHSRLFPRSADKLFTAFYTSSYKGTKVWQRVHNLKKTEFNGIPVIPQILSNNAEEIIRFGNECFKYGYNEINWNMGCPFPRVANKRRGAGLLPYNLFVNEILSEIIPHLPVKLSIKCRLGYVIPDDILKLIPVFNKFNLSEIIIHARIGKQLYKGEVNLETFQKAMIVSKIPVVYNGNIFSVEDFMQRKKKFLQLSAFMVGRGLLADPFLISEIKGLSFNKERSIVIRHFVDELYYLYRKEMNNRPQAINRMKELWSYLSCSFDNGQRVFGLIKKTKSFDEYEDAVNRVFDEYIWRGHGGSCL